MPDVHRSATDPREKMHFGHHACALATVSLLCMGSAACGSSSSTTKPGGLNGGQVAVGANAQYTAEDKQAASALTPEPGSFLHGKSTVTLLGSTTPANGDVNPYAIWPVTETIGSLTAGDVLVDNFNNKYNNGTTPFVERWPPWRQALEYDAGLLFLAYQQDPRKAFVPVFSKLAETDALSQFTTHTASAVFAVPPRASGPRDWIGSSLFS